MAALCALAVPLLLPAGGLAAEPQGGVALVPAAEATQVPLVRLKDWRDSTDHERYSFLVGFVTALDMEREWQGAKPLPLQQSLVGNWGRGLHGITLRAINDNINAYIAANPDDLNRPVVEYLWFTYVQPKVTEKVTPAKVERATKAYQKKKQSK